MLATTRQYAARVVSLLARIDSWEASYDKCELVSGRYFTQNISLCMKAYIIRMGLPANTLPVYVGRPFLSTEGEYEVRVLINRVIDILAR